MSKQLATILFAIFTGACGAPEPSSDRSPAAEALVAPAPAVAPVSGDWRARVRAHVAELKAAEPALHAELVGLAPSQTRAGLLRFTSKSIHDPRAAAVFLDRLVQGGEREPVRAALAEALPRTGGLYADAVVELVATERAALVRAMYVHSVRRAPADEAIRVLELALTDPDPTVSAEAARTAAAHPDGARAADALRAALASPDPATRAASARALGVLRVAGATEVLRARLTDRAADVRLESLRALDRIAPGSMKGHHALDALRADPDPRVAQLVARISGVPSTATTAP